MIRIFKNFVVLALCLALSQIADAQKQLFYDAINSGVPWFDDKGNAVSAHGGCVVNDGGKYFLFGEKHTDASNAFVGFNCYSSIDLYNWKFESLALPIQQTGDLSADNYVGERPKVMKCPKTGEYIMYMHADSFGYKKQYVGYAISSTITGPYKFKGPLLFNGKPIRKWDLGTFKDVDGSGYVLIHGGEIYKLSDDYKSVTEQVNKGMAQGFEAPTMFRKSGTYYFLGSDLTSWEKNDNYYYTATSLRGPWTKRGNFCPKGSLTWNSQATFVFPITSSKDTTYMFMGDRWSYPKQASAATYVWQPLMVSDTFLSIPQYQQSWQANVATRTVLQLTADKKTISNTDKKYINYLGNWQQDTLLVKSSEEKNAQAVIKFTGTQIALYALARPNGGYANVSLQNGKGKTVLSSIIDMYCKYPVSSLMFASPLLPKDNYTFTVTVLGERPNWSDKRRSIYGSTGYLVALDKLVINE